jgi:hypothetical protein
MIHDCKWNYSLVKLQFNLLKSCVFKTHNLPTIWKHRFFIYIFSNCNFCKNKKKKKEKEKEKEKKVWFKTILKIYEIAVSNETLKG